MIAIMTSQIGHYHDARYAALARSGAAFTVVSTQNEADFAEFIAKNESGYPVVALFRGRQAYREALAQGQVWPVVQGALDQIDPDAVAVAGWATPESFAAITWARKRGRRVIMLSASQATDADRSPLREFLKKRVVRQCDAALVGSPSHADYITRLGMARERVFLGYNAVDNAYFSRGAQQARDNAADARARLGLPDRYILASARFIQKKNLPRLVRAFGKAARDTDAPPDLVILGDGPERANIEETIQQNNLSGVVHLPGFKGYEDLPAFYGLSEGFAHVSTTEQWGLVINEAAASGVPVIASRACGAVSCLIKDGVTGFAVEAEKEDTIVEALRQLMNMPETERKKMGAAGQKHMSDWGPDQFAEGLLAACKVAGQGRSPELRVWDALLLQALAKREIGTVQ